ncbi:hypothetical protein HDC90_001109 [Pedobacter sp. AK013]|uniref:major capsid protein n=1 Tax=Pedobacter sp. AK013 TaxID=2723071 RepID=UPI00161515AD|nr:major capsid protein [Pedobacter sp. AK013]MBB6236497.1 hypothetical protein [Pedobacter sp. AK013]
MAITLNQHRQSITKKVIALFSDDNTPQEGLSAFFPATTTADKEVAIEVERNRQMVAVDVQRCTDATRNIFSKSTEKVFVPPYYNEKFDFTACQRYDITFQTIQSGSNPSVYDLRKLISSANKYAIALRNKIARAKEIQRAQVLQTGIVTLVNGDSIDFKRKAASIVQKTGTAQWNAPTTADPLADLKTGVTFLREEGLATGNTFNVLFGASVLSNFLANAKVQDLAKFFNQINRTDIGMPVMDKVTGYVFIGRIAVEDALINIWTYNAFYELPNGSKVKYLDPNTVVMLSEDFVGTTAHAGVPSILEVEGLGTVIAPTEGEYYVRDVIDQINLAWEFYVSSAPLAIPVSIDRIYTIKTVNA